MARNTLAVLAALTLSAFAAPVAADPFEVSTQRCESLSNIRCAEFPAGQDRTFTVGDFFAPYEVLTIERIRLLNGWDESVTLETPLREGSKIAILGNV